MFTESPVIPAMFLVHERKFQKAHEQFMQHVAEFVPSLIKGKRMSQMGKLEYIKYV